MPPSDPDNESLLLPGNGPDSERPTVEQPEGVDTHLRFGRAVKALLNREPQPVRVGRYAILRRLGAGGMSLVYAARDEELDREVAIKLLQRSFSSAPGWRGRLRREALSMAKLSHVNIAHVYEVGDHDDRPFIAMELVRGPTLGEWLRERERSVPEIIAIYVQAARGLSAAHEAGLVHRDFKPDNVIVDQSGWARVLDFGLVMTATERPSQGAEVEPIAPPSEGDDVDWATATRAGTVVGTPAYMAPEQMRGGNVDARADQFSFCVALYEALHGERPFPGRSLSEISEAIESSGNLEVTRQPGSHVPTAVSDVIRRGLQRSPQARYATMDELIDALVVAQQLRERAERSELEQAAVERDFSRNRDARIKLLIVDGLVFAGAAVVLTVLRVLGLHRAGYLDGFVVLGLFSLANAIVSRRLKAQINAINRRWHVMTMIIPPLLLVHLGLSAWAGLDFTAAMALGTVLAAGVLAGAIAMVDNTSPVLPIGLLLTSVAIYAWPPARGISLALGVVLTFAVARFFLKRRELD